MLQFNQAGAAEHECLLDNVLQLAHVTRIAYSISRANTASATPAMFLVCSLLNLATRWST
jgi:hypothetical protein